MLKYAVCEISGKQYSVEPGKPFEVTLPGLAWEARDIEVNVLMKVDDDRLKVGKPYLKEKLKLKVLETFKGKKIRVAKYHAKANYRRIKGFRANLAKVVLSS